MADRQSRYNHLSDSDILGLHITALQFLGKLKALRAPEAILADPQALVDKVEVELRARGMEWAAR